MSKVYQPHKSSVGIDANIVALLLYVIPVIVSYVVPPLQILSIALPIIILFIEKDSGLVKFHACLTLLLIVVQFIVGTVFVTLFIGLLFAGLNSSSSMAGIIGGGSIGILIGGIIVILFFVLNVVAAIKAFMWTSVRFPLIGKLVARLTKED